MSARRTRSVPVRRGHLGTTGTEVLGNKAVLLYASAKALSEAAYWHRTRRRLLTCEAASARPRAGHLGRRPPGVFYGGRMSRAHTTRPTPARVLRAPGPVRASSPELSSTSASSPKVGGSELEGSNSRVGGRALREGPPSGPPRRADDHAGFVFSAAVFAPGTSPRRWLGLDQR